MVLCSEYLNNCLYFTANALARNIGKMAENAFKGTGLSPSRAFMVMLVNENPGITQGELASHLHLAPSTLTRLADKLVYQGIVERGQEGKIVKIYPTTEGKALGKTIEAAWKQLYTEYSAILGEDTGIELTRALAEANRRLEDLA